MGAGTQSTNAIPDAIGIDRAAIFGVSCSGGRMSAVFDLHNFMGLDGPVIRYRIDDAAPVSAPIVVSAAGDKLAWQGDMGVPFLKSLVGKGRVVIEASPYNRGPVEVIFSLKGYDAAIKPIRQACNW